MERRSGHFKGSLAQCLASAILWIVFVELLEQQILVERLPCTALCEALGASAIKFLSL